MPRETYVLRDGKLVPKAKASGTVCHNVMRDIETFTTVCGTEISSRSKLREFEQRTGTRQIGNDWPGRSKPAFWDEVTRRS